jgi:N-acetylmuramoyl-L-alanine amidase
MIEITQDLIHINQFSRKGEKLRAKRGIVMHYTADRGAPARNISHYFDNLKDQDPNDLVVDRYAGAHLSVDRFTKIQSIPFDELGYHCGSSQPYLPDALLMLGSYPNNSTVGIEMCIEWDGSIHEDTFQNAAELVVHLIRNEGFPNTIFTHKGVVGWKECPLPWVQNPTEFVRFKELVNFKLMEAKQMDELLIKLNELQTKVEGLEKDNLKSVAPTWFVTEFGSADLNGQIHEPTGDENFWRTIAVVLRAVKNIAS